MVAAKKAKAAPPASGGGKGKGKRKAAPPTPAAGSLLKYFGPKAVAAAPAAQESASAAPDSQASAGSDADFVPPSLPASLPASIPASAPAATPASPPAPLESSQEQVAPCEKAAGGEPPEKRAKVEGIVAERGDYCEVSSSPDKFRRRAACKWMEDYSLMYQARLRELRGRLEGRARELWPNAHVLPSLQGYRKSVVSPVASGQRALVGVLFKRMPSRPTVAVVYHESHSTTGSLVPEAQRVGVGSLCSPNDELFLEDDGMRLPLRMPPDWADSLPTGLVIAVCGQADRAGRFVVESLCLAQLPPPAALSRPPTPQRAYLALLSGLDLQKGGPSPALARAVDFLQRSGTVQRLLICGLLAGQPPSAEELPTVLEEAGSLLSRLAATLPIDLMPGPSDPTNASLPQLPLLPCLLPKVKGCGSLHLRGNPFACTMRGGLRVLGHSGQPVVDLLRCTRGLTSPVAALQVCLEALHLAPTAPDSLAAQPCAAGGDPFVISEVPHLLFSGGHDQAEHRWYAPTDPGGPGTLCACVPAFARCPKLLLVNLHRPCDVQVRSFAEPGQ